MVVVDLRLPGLQSVPTFIALGPIERGEIMQFSGRKVADVKTCGKPQGLKHVLFHENIKALTAQPLKNRADHAVIQVGVGEEDTRSAVETVRAGGKVFAAGVIFSIRQEELLDIVLGRDGIHAAVAQGGGVGQKHPQGDGGLRVVGVAQRETEIAAYVQVKIQYFLLNKAHDPHGGEDLGNGSCAETCV